MAQPAAKRRKILREQDVKRMMDESEDESEAETEILSQEDDGDGWLDSDTKQSHMTMKKPLLIIATLKMTPGCRKRFYR